MAAGLAAGNGAIKRLRKLCHSARQRRADGVVVVEGPRAVATAVEAGATVQAVYVEVDSHRELGAELAARGLEIRPVAVGVLDKVLSTASPQPIAAVVARPETATPIGTARAGSGPVLVLAGVSDPGNMGTILRSVVASGAGPVLIGPSSADPFGPKAVRASVGTVFHADVHELDDLSTVLGELRAAGWSILGAAPRDGRPHDQVDLTGPTVLVLGGETSGLPDAVAEDDVVSIPQLGPAESMNVAMAATVLVFEAARQRSRGEMP